MSEERSWAVLELTGYTHVVPWLGSEAEGDVAPGHDPSPLCPCRPAVIRNAPLDEPIISHHQPDWPGVDPERIARELA